MNLPPLPKPYYPQWSHSNEFDAYTADQLRQAPREAVAAAVPGGWLPIETAPKDGTRIIIGSTDGAWMAEYKPVYQSGYRPENPWFSVMLNLEHIGMFPKAKPTHWMPLPPPPEVKP